MVAAVASEPGPRKGTDHRLGACYPALARGGAHEHSTAGIRRCDRHRLIWDNIGTGLPYTRQPGADRQFAGDEVRSTRRAACLGMAVNLAKDRSAP